MTREHWLALCVIVAVALGASRAQAQTITMTPNSIDVGNVRVGGMPGSATGTLTVNPGTKLDLVLGACSGGGGTFTISPTDQINLNGNGASATITVTYTATASGRRSCTVTAYHENYPSNTTSYGSFTITANGQMPPALSLSTTMLDFGSRRFNNAAPNATASRSVTVTNTGDEQLNITSVATSNADYQITAGGTSATLAGGAARTWTIEFDPTSPAGARNATLSFTSNAPGSPATVSLAGVSTTASIDVTPDPTADFGVVAVGAARPRDTTVTNVAANNKGPLGVTSATITGGSWFSFTNCGAGATTCTFSPAFSITDDQVVAVTCAPPLNASGSQTGTLTFTSDSDTAGGNSVGLACEAGASNLVPSANATTITNVDFGSVWLRDTGRTSTFTLTNSGNVASPTFALVRTGANADQFGATSDTCATNQTSGCALGASGAMQVVVTFDPDKEGPLAAGLDMSSASISLTGRGTECHIAVDPAAQFPDAYRNPGAQAPTQTIPIENTGEYPLTITSLTIDGDPAVWSIVEPAGVVDVNTPFVVAPLTTVSVGVRFSPVVAGKAADGSLRILSNDPDPMKQMQQVILSGNGKNRNVDMTPGSIDLGDTFAGIPTQLSIVRPDDLVLVENKDVDPFVIREIRIEGDGAEAFEIRDLSGNTVSNRDLASGELQEFDVVFSPSFVGEYEATIVLYLDEDPLGLSPVPVRGRALWVDARGSGGCSTSGDASGGLVLVVLAGGLVVVRRRRR